MFFMTMAPKWFTFCFVLFLFVICVEEANSLKDGDVGTCRGKVSSVATKRVSYSVSGYCQRGSRRYICRKRKYRIQNYIVSKMGTICCNGWQHDAENDVCKPVCSTGCLNGTCIAPEKCQCNSPLYLDPSRKNVCISPVCDPPCTNSVCVNKQMSTNKESTRNICECLNNTRRYNETHCALCEENYRINEDLTCTPECNTTCVNSECIAPNKCKCYEGFKQKDDFSCESYCGECVNGKCVGSKCECLSGFSAVNETHCVRCDCENGDCVLGQCVCREGYYTLSIDGFCEPICGQCVNGICTAPGVCTCFEGHSKSEDTAVCCRPECGKVCDSNGECPSVACMPRKRIPIPNCTPTSRKRCFKVVIQEQMICCAHWKYIAQDDKCEPICKSGCVNAECIAPDTCSCLPGFLEHNETTCIPHCDNPCYKGFCSAPNECTCDPQYQLDPTNKYNCQPICETQCVNASCISPNTCKCNPGYEPQNSWQCKPICDSCQNGECIAPNNCRCNEGYQMQHGQCTPVCDQPCFNGHCSMPNVCTCQAGYKLDPLNHFACAPICEPECINSKCLSPNICSCDEGYEKESDFSCKPICDNCENGMCVGPNVCVCSKGFEMQGGLCTPVCDEPCQNGDCTKPNFCSCHDGYKHSSVNKYICNPICEPKCENATCVSPNTCTCNSGYEFVEKWKCKPICDSCENGLCIAPNTCSCKNGYEMQNGRCFPVCDHPCINGRCIRPNECECNKGFKLDTRTLACEPICKPGCVKSKCVKPNKCLCFDGYEETSKPFVCKPTCESCQNGICVAPGRCNCNEGYIMKDKKCSPMCSEECKNGYCSSPNNCTCLGGYVKKEGYNNICYMPCAGPCDNGFCNEYGVCKCHTGFEIQNDTCLPIDQVDCNSCEGNCTTDENCRCANGAPCYLSPSSEEVTTSASMAGLQWSWMLGGGVGLLLIILLLVVIQRIWARRQLYSEKPQRDDLQRSVVYHTVVPNTLINSKIPDDVETQDGYYDEVAQESLPEVQDSLLGSKAETDDEHV